MLTLTPDQKPPNQYYTKCPDYNQWDRLSNHQKAFCQDWCSHVQYCSPTTTVRQCVHEDCQVLNHPAHHLVSVGHVRKCRGIYLVIKSNTGDSLTKAMNQSFPDVPSEIIFLPFVSPYFAIYLKVFSFKRTISSLQTSSRSEML